jgi:ABC-type glycerol-3-phosphate transport system permease component
VTVFSAGQRHAPLPAPATVRPVPVRVNKPRRAPVVPYVVVIAWVAVSLAPVLWMLSSSIKPPADVFAIPPKWLFHISFQNYADLFSTATGSQFGRYITMSLVVTLGTTVLAMLVSVPGSYALTFLPVKRRSMWMSLILLASMLPPIVIVVPLFDFWQRLNQLDSPVSLIFTYAAMNTPFTIWLVRGFMAQIPRELYESARIDGATHMTTLLRVMVPLVRAGMAAAAIFVVINSWNELLFALFLTNTNRTAPAGIVATLISDRGMNWGRLYAASTAVALPIIVFTIAVQRHVVRGFTFGAVKG